MASKETGQSYRVASRGPTGRLEPSRYVDPATVLEGTAKEAAHVYRSSADDRFAIGVWECSACKERIDNYPFDEFCVVIEGAVTVTDDAGKTDTYRVGDCFVMEAGWSGIWHMTQSFRKYFVIYQAA